MFSGFMGIVFVFTTSLMDYETNKDAIMKLFKRPFKVKERISFSTAICGIINVQEVKEIDVLIDYLEYLVQLKPKSDRTILIQNDQHTKEGFLYEQEVKNIWRQQLKRIFLKYIISHCMI